MKRGIVIALAIAGLATAAAAAWSSRIIERPAPAIPKRAQSEELPTWGGKDRIFLTKAQVFQARAQGAIDRDVHSILNVRKRMHYGDFVWNDRDVLTGQVWVRVDLERQLISVYRAGHEIGTAVILYGADEKETPDGVFPVIAKIKDHKSITYDNAPMPYTLRLTDDGVSIHGSDVRWGRATHGCIGVPIEFAQKLFGQVSKGDEVVIISDRTGTRAG
jgi:lipoprotein-anchoring transpeptidase ErfK/SrfK